MRSFKNSLCSLLIASIAMPWSAFASSNDVDASGAYENVELQIQEVSSEDDLLSKLPAEVRYLEVVTSADAAYAEVLSQPVDQLTPIGRKVQNRKTKDTIQLVCLDSIAAVKDCTRFQARRNSAALTGPKYILKKMMKEQFVAQFKSKFQDTKEDKRWKYVSYEDIPMTECYGDFQDWYWSGGGALFGAAGLLSAIGIGVLALNSVPGGAAFLIGLGSGLAIGFAPFVIGTLVVVGAGGVIFGHNRLSDLTMKIRKIRVHKAFRAMLDADGNLEKPFQISNKNFKILEKSFN